MDKKDIERNLLRFGLEIGFLFAGPAILAVIIGKKLDVYFGAGKKEYTFIALAAAFIISWIIVIIKYKNLTKKIR